MTPSRLSLASGDGGGNDRGIGFGPFSGCLPHHCARALRPCCARPPPHPRPPGILHLPWCPSCLPLNSAWEEGAIAHGGLSLPSSSCAAGIFLRTAVVDDALPLLALCALWCAFCPMSRYWLKFYYQRGSSGRSTNDCNNNDKGATAHVTLLLPSRDNNAAPPDHLLQSRRCRGGGVATSTLRSC